MKIKQSLRFEFKKFSPKSKKVINIYKNKFLDGYDGLICQGAVRSSKTFSLILSQILYVNETANGTLNLFGGITSEGIQNNYVNDAVKILQTLGFKVRQTKNIVVVENKFKKNGFKKGHTNYFEIKSGDNARSPGGIQGRTYYTIFVDEAAKCNQEYLKMAISRLSYKNSKFFMACNPEGNENHWFYKEYIAKAKEKNIKLMHFLLDDNHALAEEVKIRYKRQFTGSFYKRMIEGLWVIAEGLVYPMFSEKNIIPFSEIPLSLCSKFYISGDYGTQNAMTWGLFGVAGKRVFLIKEYHYSGREKKIQKTDYQYANEFEIFYKECLEIIENRKIIYSIFDPSAVSFITELKSRKFLIKKAVNDVSSGISLVSNAIDKEELLIADTCKETIKEFEQYSWDEKALDRGVEEPKKEHDHHMDKIRYFFNTVMKKRTENSNFIGV